mgnify:CR=1 FL=1|tara:strand:+ start:311 stop:682 length:372 start_codon:yes stop_codon:yes gene_type:complete
MSESEGTEINGGKLEDFTIDQFAGAAALIISSIGALLTIIWQSRCLCRVRIGFSDKCYLFDCERAPPKEEEEDKKKKDKKDKVGGTKDDKQTSSQLLDPPQTDESIIPQSSKDSNITATISEP